MKHGPRSYVGVDIRPGPGVDIVCPAENLNRQFGDQAFDIVFATEVVEHIRDWRTAIENMMNLVRIGGVLLLTTRSPGYPYHGSPHDYWRYDASSFRAIFQGWSVVALEDDPHRPGIFVSARKLEHKSPNLGWVELYSVALGRRSLDVTTVQILLHRVASPRRAVAWLTPDRLKPFLRRIAKPFGYSTDYRGPSTSPDA
jgi:hypothetical protein